MMLLGLNNIVQDPEDAGSQIKFCELMAITTAGNGDRDISNMYTAIIKTIQKTEPSKIQSHDRFEHTGKTTHPMDTPTIQNGEHASGNGEGTGKHQKEKYS